jgi:hypothetical protein
MYWHSKHVEQKIKQVTSVGLSLFNYYAKLAWEQNVSFSCHTAVTLTSLSEVIVK